MKFILASLLLFASLSFGQTPTQPTAGTVSSSLNNATTNDLFFMIGSDFDRPGLIPRANYNVGWGHTYDFLSKHSSWIGDELTISYTYEIGGPHGFWHSSPGSNTDSETVGLMKNFNIPFTSVKKVTMYTWPQIGLTSIVGGSGVENRLYGGFALGGIIHLPHNTSIWMQEAYNKVVTVPWYTTTSIGFTLSWK